ncbi:MAG: oligosaccharide repeat unit polymerase [Candidatus Pacebacteria bacterium]|nr:oligosaccharide repeat unit polymerase [Candidatus Paceibacterota bacterium]
MLIKKIENLYRKIDLKILLVLFFLFSRIFFSLYFKENYQDDWYHIVSGKFFFENFKFPILTPYFDNFGYIRGSYVSILVGLFMKIFGESIFIARFVPILMSTLNFLILYKISEILLKDKKNIIFVMLLYSIHPYLILNSLYIRMYVFYDFVFFISFYLTLKKFSLNNKLYKNTLFVILFLIIFISLSSFDRGSYLTSFYSIALLVVFYFLKKYLENQKVLKMTFLISFSSLFLYFSFNLSNFLIRENLIVKGAGGLGSLFLDEYLVFSIFVFSNFLFYSYFKNIKKQFFILSSFLIIFASIFLIPSEYQAIRGFSFLFPLFFINFALGLEKIYNFFGKNVSYLFYVIAIFTISRTYTPGFIQNGPEIPGEIGIYSFDESYKKIINDYKDKKIIQFAYNIVPDLFYGKNTDYIFNQDENIQKEFFPEYVTHITNLDDLRDINLIFDTCILISDFSYTKLMNEETQKYIKENYYLVFDNHGYDFVCENY